MNGRAWSQQEDTILMEYYPTEKSKVISRLPERTSGGIERRAGMLGLTAKAYAEWTPEELHILRERYPLDGYNIPELIKTRTIAAIKGRASAEGLTRKARPWTTDEDAIVSEYYPLEGPNCCSRLNGRTRMSVQNRAKQMGISLGGARSWPVWQLNLLREKYSSQGTNIPELAELHSKGAISYKARELGLTADIRERYQGKTFCDWLKELNLNSRRLKEQRVRRGSLEEAVKYFQQEIPKNSRCVVRRSTLVNISKVAPVVYAAVCPVCARKLLVTGQEAIDFQHSEEFCSSHEWEEYNV